MDAGDIGSRVRLRQAVLVARELEPAAAELQAALGLAEPFRDPGVGMFGLANTVFAIGDCAQHEGMVGGLVAPAWEQARVVADLIAGADPDARYRPMPPRSRSSPSRHLRCHPWKRLTHASNLCG